MGSSSRLALNGSPSTDYVPSSEALAILDVKPQTLYSYVSRGLVRRISPNGRASFYNREDIQRLRARSEARSGHGAVAESAMHWGEPILVTSITEITVFGPRYRQHFALDLAREDYPFESIAEYLWTANEPEKAANWPIDKSVMRIAPHLAGLLDHYPDVHIRQLLTETVLLLSMARTVEADDPAGAFSISTARTLIQAMCCASGLLGPRKSFVRPAPGESIAGIFARAFGIDASHRQLRAINAAFVLLADHEFTPATFSARIAASAGVDLHSCIGAALQVHFGSALGLRCDRIEKALPPREKSPHGAELSETGPGHRLFQVGFRHPLYANGDPRAQRILQLAMELEEHRQSAHATLDRLRQIDDGDGRLSLDAALVVFCRALGIDKPVAGGLLALSRAAGWIAHVAEQRQQDFMIRPRGKFTGRSSTADVQAA